MAGYTIIGDVSEKLISILQKELVPDLITGNDGIALCSPADKSDVSLGLFLFDVRESEEIRRSTMVTHGMNSVQYPPIFINLYYMVTAYSIGNAKYKMIAEERILGRVIQLFHDYPMIAIDDVASGDMNGVDMRIEMLRLDLEQKSKIWNFRDTPYKTSIFYKISPICIDSARLEEVSRVRQVEINVDSKNNING